MKTKTTLTKRGTQQSSSSKPHPSWLLWILLIVAMAGSFHEYVIKRADGSYELREERKKKMNREIEELDEAYQYALFAAENGFYLCYNCGVQATIFLKRGEVWKYGFTTKRNRYPKKFLENTQLVYVVQYTGSMKDCLKEEKRKIYNYPLLPENLARSFKLPRPPGNKQDN